MLFYDYLGRKVEGTDNVLVEYGVYKGTAYSHLRINKKKYDGSLQYPFVRKTSTNTTVTQLVNTEKWPIALNASAGSGLTIENGVLVSDISTANINGVMPLTIDGDGDLSYSEATEAGIGQTLINRGIVSAVSGFFPIVDNYVAFDYPTTIPDTFDNPNWVYAQRNLIGQYANGDYGIITSDGRGYNNSVGLTIPELQELCLSMGMKFAYNLDGGGSTLTYVGKKNLNIIYEGTGGRNMQMFIVFNGTSSFGFPNVRN